MNKDDNRQKLSISVTNPSVDYALLDTGDGEKLERLGQIILARPDPQALWSKRLPPTEWKNAHGYFTRDEKKGEWRLKPNAKERWPIGLADLKFWIKPTPFKHVGIFPEQIPNWQWMQEKIIQSKKRVDDILDTSSIADRKSSIKVLNLFGYTGGASLVCANAGAEVVHVDGSRSAIKWARDNAELSGLDKKPIRWIMDDAREFVRREIKRGNKYDGIIMDPPAFGHGPEGELWKIEEHLPLLIDECMKILSDKPIFFLINGYASGYSATAYENLLMRLTEDFGGQIERGELSIIEDNRSETPSRRLPCGIFARWSK